MRRPPGLPVSFALAALLAACVLAACVLAACGPDAPGEVIPDAPPGTPDAGHYADGAPFPDVAPIPDAGPPPFFGSVYAHSADQLFKVDPDTLDVTLVGSFTFPAGTGDPFGTYDPITDIALDKDANMVGISYTEVYAIDKDTAACTHLATLMGTYNGLSFIPADEIDPTGAEILVGADLGGSLSQIDPATGNATVIGSYGGGWGSSGDIVSVHGFGTVATVAMGEAGPDYLARIDVYGGGTATIIGSTGFEDVWGLGFWKGQIYGFTDNQEFILIDPATGAGHLVEMSMPYWWGAGVTTEAPIIP